MENIFAIPTFNTSIQFLYVKVKNNGCLSHMQSVMLMDTCNTYKKRGGDDMADQFIVSKKEDKIYSINRTIRFKPTLFDQIQQLSAETGVSFGKIVNQCIEYALLHLEQDHPARGAED